MNFDRRKLHFCFVLLINTIFFVFQFFSFLFFSLNFNRIRCPLKAQSDDKYCHVFAVRIYWFDVKYISIFNIELIEYVILGNIMTAAHGSTNSWPSANFLALQKSETSLPSGPLSVHEAALVISIHYIGAIVGNLMVSPIVRKYGCKRVMMTVAIPQIVS